MSIIKQYLYRINLCTNIFPAEFYSAGGFYTLIDKKILPNKGAYIINKAGSYYGSPALVPYSLRAFI